MKWPGMDRRIFSCQFLTFKRCVQYADLIESVLQVLRMGQNGATYLPLKAVCIVSLVCLDQNAGSLLPFGLWSSTPFFSLLCAPPGKLHLLFGASRTEFLFPRLILNSWDFSQLFLFIFNSSIKEWKPKSGTYIFICCLQYVIYGSYRKQCIMSFLPNEIPINP